MHTHTSWSPVAQWDIPGKQKDKPLSKFPSVIQSVMTHKAIVYHIAPSIDLKTEREL